MATCGTLTVESQDDGDGGTEFDPSAVTLPAGACEGPSPATASPGETVTVSVTVNNPNTIDASVEIIVVDGTGSELARTTETVLGGGSTVPVTFPAPSSAGDYGIEVQLGEVSQSSGGFLNEPRQRFGGSLRSLRR